MIGEFIDTVSYLEYGILIASFIIALLMLLIKGINDKKQFTPLAFIISVVLCVFLSFQMSRLVGACQFSSTTSQINDIVGAVSPTLSKYISSSTRSDIGWFIARRVLWSLLSIGIAGFGIIATMKRKHKGSIGSYESYDSSVDSTNNEWGI